MITNRQFCVHWNIKIGEAQTFVKTNLLSELFFWRLWAPECFWLLNKAKNYRANIRTKAFNKKVLSFKQRQIIHACSNELVQLCNLKNQKCKCISIIIGLIKIVSSLEKLSSSSIFADSTRQKSLYLNHFLHLKYDKLFNKTPLRCTCVFHTVCEDVNQLILPFL